MVYFMPPMDHFMPTMDHLCQFASKLVHMFSKYHVHNFGDRRTNGQMNGQAENIMLPPTSLVW